MSTKVIEMEKKAASKNARLRLDAGLVYMTDQEGMSIDDLSKDERFRGVSKRTLERWSKEDRWVERRSEFFEKWAAIARERLGSQLCQLRQQELTQLEEIQMLAMDKIRSELTGPKSWEGVVKVLLDANRRVESLAAAIGTEIMPGQQQARFGGGGGVQLSEVEKSTLAKQILSMRRDAVRGQLAEQSQVVDVEPTPADDQS